MVYKNTSSHQGVLIEKKIYWSVKAAVGAQLIL